MEPAWRAEVGGKSELLEHLMMLLFEGDLYEKKNAALCFGNLCCDWYGPCTKESLALIFVLLLFIPSALEQSFEADLVPFLLLSLSMLIWCLVLPP